MFLPFLSYLLAEPNSFFFNIIMNNDSSSSLSSTNVGWLQNCKSPHYWNYLIFPFLIKFLAIIPSSLELPGDVLGIFHPCLFFNLCFGRRLRSFLTMYTIFIDYLKFQLSSFYALWFYACGLCRNNQIIILTIWLFLHSLSILINKNLTSRATETSKRFLNKMRKK